MKIQRIILFLNGERGVVLLNHLLAACHPIIAVVASEKSSFWKKKGGYGEIIQLKQTDVNEKEFVEHLRSYQPDLFVVAGFSSIFKKEILSIPRIGVINLHGGPLPHYRGGSPLNWQIINDEKKIGISLIFMDEGIDTGDVIAEKFFPCESKDDINSIHKKANKHFCGLVLNALNNIKDDSLLIKKQEENESCYWVQRTSEESLINWSNKTAIQIFNLIRALKPPYPPAFSFFEGKKVFFFDAEVPSKKINGTPGRVVFIQGKGPYIICKDRAILIKNASEKLTNGMCKDV